jgi:hypothetical protein
MYFTVTAGDIEATFDSYGQAWEFATELEDEGYIVSIAQIEGMFA